MPPAPAPAASAPPPAPPARRRTAPAHRPLVLGTVFAVLLAATVVAIFASFAGTFSSYAVVQAQLPASSNAVALNAPVEFRNVAVGTVASQGVSVPGGLVVVTLHMNPSMLHSIPAGVTATVIPVSIFGDPYVVLEPPPNPGSATLSAGARIPALTVGETASLQATLGDLDTLLVGLHPAELDAALTALAGALQGEGTALGQNLDRANTYLEEMLPLWPTVVSDLDSLVPVARQFAASTPDILAILANQTTTGRTIESEAAGVREVISGGATLATETTDLLTAIEQPYAVLAADAGPFLKDIAQSPNEISDLFQGLDAWAKAWTAAESSGPSLDLTTDVAVANPADLGLAVLGGAEVAEYLSAGLGPGYVNPATYSSAGTITSPGQGGTAASAGPSSPATTAAARAEARAELASVLTSVPAQVMDATAESRAVAQIVEAVSGAAPGDDAVSALLLSPVLSNLVQQR
jgi:phospholipid/cholesterol/gamma-HCH transport system substrate-binding protein